MKKITSAALGISTALALLGQTALASETTQLAREFTAQEFSEVKELPGMTRVKIDGKLYQLTGDMLEPIVDTSDHVGIMSAFEISANKWPEGIVYYDFFDDVTEENRQRFVEATKVWEEIADLTFVKRTDQNDFIHVRNGSENRSMVGKSGGGQFFSMFNWENKYIIIHELGHAIGMRHEQQRSDRDNYVEIIEENVEPSYLYNFDVRQTHNYSEYDFLSVMHYSSHAYSVNGKATIVPKTGFEKYSNQMALHIDLGGGDQVSAASHYGAVNLSIPDETFKSYLVANYDTDQDGEINSLEAANVTEIRTPGTGSIQSIEGVHFFRYLKHLTVSNEALTVMPELPKRLETLNISGNQLDSAKFEWVMNKPFLTTVDVTNNPLDVYSCESLSFIENVMNGGIQYSPALNGETLICDEEAALTLISGKSKLDLRNKGEKTFHIDVSENATSLVIRTDNTVTEQENNQNGEMNLFVAFNRLGSSSDFDFKSENAGNIEEIIIANPEAGRWYITLNPVERSFEGVNLTATVIEGQTPNNELINQQWMNDLAANEGQALFFTMAVPEGATDLKFIMTGSTGDADMYVRFASKPTASDYDYRPYLTGNEETVVVNNPRAGVWHVMLLGYSDFRQVKLQGSFTQASSEFLRSGETVADLSGKSGEQLTFKIQVPEGATQLTVKTGPSFIGSTGDADLYIKYGEQATKNNADHASENWTSRESINVGTPQAGIWHVTVQGYTDFENIWLSVEY